MGVNSYIAADIIASDRTTMNFGLANGLRQCLTIDLVDDIVTEDKEQFQIIMEAITPGAELGIANATIVIIDNDGKYI